MKFVKLLIPRTIEPERFDVTEWRLILSTHIDVLEYARHDQPLMAKAFIQLERTPDGLFDAAHARDTKVAALGAMLNVAYARLKEGQTFIPYLEAGKLLDRKTQVMMEMIERGEEVSINYAGGFCGYDNYLTTWKAKEIDSVDTSTINFPKVA